MLTRRRIFIAGAMLVAGAVAWVAVENRARNDADSARTEELLDEAHRILAASRGENLIVLATAEFAAAESQLSEATVVLGAGRSGIALPLARVGLELTQGAREVAIGRLPVARAAVVRGVRNKVLYRAADAVAWGEAKVDMNLFDSDRIATKARSEAIVAFDEDNEMRVEANSVLVVESLAQSKTEQTLSMTLSLPEGGFRSRIARSDNHNVKLRINLPSADILVDTARIGGGEADIAAHVEPGAADRVAVYSGEAEVVAPSGERLTLRSNEFTEVAPDGSLTEVRALPSAAIILLPGRDATVYVSEQRPEVTFKWKRVDECAAYRLELARDADFLDELLDERITRGRFTYGNLEPGSYLWRMSCLDDAGLQGHYSDVTHFEVVEDNDAPQLDVLSPAVNAVVDGAQLEARCKTEPGVSVFINGEEAKADGREFARVVTLAQGVNTLVFEAIDEAGNVMYNSRLVTRTR